ncbi:MAG TPA: hypothetical protein VIM77_14365 [Mucilaginibacter sp.]
MKAFAVLVGIVIVIFSTLGIINCNVQLQIQNQGHVVAMKIIEIPGVCSGTKAKYFMKVVYGGVIYSKQIGANFCESHHTGDTIKMKYLEGKNEILFPDDDVVGNLIAAVAICLFGLFIIVYALKTI